MVELIVLRVATLTMLVYSTLLLQASQQDEDPSLSESSKFSLIYDGRVGPIKIGVIEAHLAIEAPSYTLDGSITGSGPIARLLD
ncbi:MAG: hypothetical protein OXG24_13630, partial [Gammaproteobacteria bacterium]|nr:hypothetical protein [Gammaproteobacteria bacterium]